MKRFIPYTIQQFQKGLKEEVYRCGKISEKLLPVLMCVNQHLLTNWTPKVSTAVV